MNSGPGRGSNLVSAVNGAPVPNGTVFFGEIGLGGEIRQVPQPDIRMKEAARLGFDRAVLPARKKDKDKKPANELLRGEEIQQLQDLVDMFAPPRAAARHRA